MAQELSEQLTRIGHKTELIVTRYETLRSENASLRRELDEARAALQSRDILIQRLEQQVEFFKIAGAIAPDKAATAEARAVIANLVREIDACVADLMKDI